LRHQGSYFHQSNMQFTKTLLVLLGLGAMSFAAPVDATTESVAVEGNADTLAQLNQFLMDKCNNIPYDDRRRYK
jgi:hypothetical protein